MILICFQEKLIYSNRFITVLISYCTSEQSVQEDREKKKNKQTTLSVMREEEKRKEETEGEGEIKIKAI